MVSPGRRFQKTGVAWRKRLLWLTSVLVVYLVVGFFVAPAILKWQLRKQLPPLTKRNVSVQQVKMNPLTLSLTIRGLALTEPDGQRFASWDELYVNFQSSSLFRWAWTFKDITLVKPQGHVILQEDGQLNFANMFPPATNAPPEKESTVPRVNIFSLLVTNGFLSLEDKTRRSPFRTEYRPINVNITGFTTRPGTGTPYSFHAESDAGRSLSWAGDLTVQPLRSTGTLQVVGIILPKYQPYLEDYTTALLTNGSMNVDLVYHMSADTNGFDVVVKDSAIQVNDFKLLDPTGAETVLGFPLFSIEGASFNLRERTATIALVKLEEPTLLGRLDQKGRLNLLEMMVPPEPSAETNQPASAAPAAPAPPAAPGPPGTPASAVPWVARLGQFILTNATVAFEDLSRPTPFKTTLHPIHLKLETLSTETGSNATYQVELATESSETISAAGKVSVNPISSSGEVSVNGVLLPKYMPYAEQSFRGKLAGGKVDVQVPYEATLGTNILKAAISNMRLHLAGLEVKSPEDETVITVKDFSVDQIEANLQERKARVGRVSSEEGSILARRLKDGSINLLALMPVQTNAAPTEASTNAAEQATAPLTANVPEQTNAAPPRPAPLASSPSPWAVNLDELDLRNYTVKIEDQQPATPASFLIDQVTLNVKGLSTDQTAEITPVLSLRFNETGSFHSQGKARMEPLSAQIDLALTNIDLRCLRPYVGEFAALDLASGEFGTSGHVDYNEKGQPMLVFRGDLHLGNFKSLEAGSTNDFAAWSNFSLAGIDAQVQPNRLKIAELKWTEPSLHVLLDEKRNPNVSQVLKRKGEQPGSKEVTKAEETTSPAPEVSSKPNEPSSRSAQASNEVARTAQENPPASASASSSDHGKFSPVPATSTQRTETASTGSKSSTPADAESSNSEFPIEIASVVLENAVLSFTDQSIDPPAKIALREVGGSIKGLSSDPKATANIALSGLIGEKSPFSVNGTMNPLAPTMLMDLVISNADTQLAPLTPYMEKYAGYPLLRGRVSTTLHYQLQGLQLKAENKIVVEQLMLGAKNNSPDATSAPVKLGVALLKDSQGKINLDIPVTGSLDDPSFSVTPVVMKVVMNMIIKAATSPFKLLGALVGGGEELSFVEFAPGADTIPEGEVQKLTKLTKALQQRPALNLEIEGAVDPATDRLAIAKQKLKEQLVAKHQPQTSNAGGADVSDPPTEIDPQVYNDLVRQAFIEKFSTNIAAVLQTNQQVLAQATQKPAPKKKPFHKKVLGVFGFGGPPKSATEKKLSKADRQALGQATPQAMEILLANSIEVTPEDYSNLMAARAKRVEEWLIQSGNVSAERLVILPPRQVKETASQGKESKGKESQGQSRVTMAVN